MSRGSSGSKISAGGGIGTKIMVSMGTILVLATLLTGFCLYTVMMLPPSGARPDRSPAQPTLKSGQPTEKLASLLLEARTIEQQFHQQQTPASVTQFEEVSKNLLAQALDLEKNAKQSSDLKVSLTAAQIIQLVSQYNTSFRELVQAWEAKGVQADREIPPAVGQVGKTRGLEEALLQLGRAEHSYFTDRSAENQRLLVNAASSLAKAAGESDLEATELQAINKSIHNYTLAFDRYQAVSLATTDPALSASFAAEQIKQEKTMHQAALELEKLISGLNPPQGAVSSAALSEQNKNIEELTAGVNNSFSALQARIKSISAKAAPPAPGKTPAFGLTPQLSLMIIAGAWLAIVLVTLLLARILTRSVTSPIQRMTDITRRMAARDDIGLTFPPEKNEFGGLASALNILMHQQTAGASGNEAAATELTTKAANLTRLIRDKVDHDTRFANVVADQEALLARIRTAVDQLSADAGLIHQIAGGLTEHGQAMRQAAAGCEQSVAASVETVQAITRSAEQMASVITAYADLAEQTSVAALNAAIKATRSGAQGKEFSAVTEELNRLVKRSSEAVKEITFFLNNMTSRLADGEKLGNESRQALQHLTATSLTSLQAHEEFDRTAKALRTGTGDTSTLLAELGKISAQVDSLVHELEPLNKTVEDTLSLLENPSGKPAGADLQLEDMMKILMQDSLKISMSPGLSAEAAGHADRS
jgi:methyl-accepting chemotaxis protein